MLLLRYISVVLLLIALGLMFEKNNILNKHKNTICNLAPQLGKSMITTVALYIVLTIAGIYAANKTTEVVTHVITEDTEKYKACVKVAKDPKKCRTLE